MSAKHKVTMIAEIRSTKWLDGRYVKPCPSCGGRQIYINRSLRRWWSRYFVNCENCYYCGKTALSLTGALNKWNRRVHDESND